MPILIKPNVELHAAWLESHREWGDGLHEDGFGILPSDETTSTKGFTTWLERLAVEEHGLPGGESNYRCVYRWIVEDDAVMGGIALRYGDESFTRVVGHVGYGIRPSARRRGLATWALSRMLNHARDVDLGSILLVCEANNAESAATIERNSGVLDAIEDTDDGPMRRYWIRLK